MENAVPIDDDSAVVNDSIVLSKLKRCEPSNLLQSELFIALMTDEEFNPHNKECLRSATLAITDANVSLDHIKVGGEAKTNFMCTPEAVAANLERLKLLKTLLNKLKEMHNAFLTSRGDNTKA